MRMGYLLNLVSLGFIPVHTWVPCEASGGILSFVFVVMLVVLVLCLFTSRSDPQQIQAICLRSSSLTPAHLVHALRFRFRQVA